MSSRPNLKAEVCRSRYKAAVDAEEGHRRRKDSIVEIRTNRREEILQKKRREGFQAQAASAAENKGKKEPSAPPLGDIGSDEMPYWEKPSMHH